MSATKLLESQVLTPPSTTTQLIEDQIIEVQVETKPNLTSLPEETGAEIADEFYEPKTARTNTDIADEFIDPKTARSVSEVADEFNKPRTQVTGSEIADEFIEPVAD